MVVVAAASLGVAAQRDGAAASVVRAVDHLACDGVTDDRPAMAELLAGAGAGRTIVLDGCRVGLSGTGARAFAALNLPSNTRIVCTSPTSSGFVALGRACAGGGSAGAACESNQQCDGGTCAGDAFCPGPDDACTMLASSPAVAGGIDDPPRGQGVVGCGFWANGWDPFYRCAGGADAGKPCLQRCTGNASVSCDQDADCAALSAGACRPATAFCVPEGDVSHCSGAPGRPSGEGRITIVDFASAADTVIRDVVVYDHRRGDVAIRGGGAVVSGGAVGAVPVPHDVIADVDTARLSMMPAYPLGLERDTFPATFDADVTTGIVAAAPTDVARVRVHATTTGIRLEGADSAIDVASVRVTGPGGVGIVASGAHATIRGAAVTLGAPDQMGIDAAAPDATIAQGRVAGSDHPGQTGIRLSGTSGAVDRMKVILPNAERGTAVVTRSSHDRVVRSELVAATYGIHATASTLPDLLASGCEFAGNHLRQAGAGPSVGLYLEACAQTRVTSNDFLGLFTPILVDGRMANTTIDGNRLRFGVGPKIVLNGPGHQVTNNYLAWGTAAGRSLIEIGGSLRSAAVGHAQIRQNVMHAEQPGVACVRFVDFGLRCDGGSRAWQPCAADAVAECPGATCGDCCAGQVHADVRIDGNAFLNCAVGVDLADLRSGAVGAAQLAITGNTVAPRVRTFVRYPPDAARCGDSCDVVGNVIDAGVPEKLAGWVDGMGVVKGNTHVDVGEPVDELRSVQGDAHVRSRTFQATTTTHDGTPGVLWSAAIRAGRTMLVHARVVARRIGGTAGHEGDGGGYVVSGVFESGTQIGGAQQIVAGESQAAWDAALVYADGAARLQVMGADGNDVAWDATIIVDDAGG